MAYGWYDFNTALKFAEAPYVRRAGWVWDKVVDPVPPQRRWILIMDLCTYVECAKARHYDFHSACRPNNDSYLRNMLKFPFAACLCQNIIVAHIRLLVTHSALLVAIFIVAASLFEATYGSTRQIKRIWYEYRVIYSFGWIEKR